MKKITVALLFGSISSEHEVSRVSCGTFVRGLNAEKYDQVKIGITKDGRWLRFFGSADAMADGSWEFDSANRKCVLSPDRSDHGFLQVEADGSITVVPVDVIIPVLHGRNGEDGRVPALCQLAGIPFVGCDMLSSAVCMDKAVANTILDAEGIPRCEWAWCSAREARNPDAVIARVTAKLNYPIFVKPANAGSSVGITKAHNRAELEKAITTALKEDSKVVFERFVDGQEVECAVLGNENAVSTRPGEILAGDEFYTYDDKYKNGVSRTLMTANLPEEKLDEVKAWAEKAYHALGCEGLSRCDFFVERGTGKVLLNEVNTLPGFTEISMYPKLEENAGLPLPKLLDSLISLALERKEPIYG